MERRDLSLPIPEAVLNALEPNEEKLLVEDIVKQHAGSKESILALVMDARLQIWQSALPFVGFYSKVHELAVKKAQKLGATEEEINREGDNGNTLGSYNPSRSEKIQ